MSNKFQACVCSDFLDPGYWVEITPPDGEMYKLTDAQGAVALFDTMKDAEVAADQAIADLTGRTQ